MERPRARVRIGRARCAGGAFPASARAAQRIATMISAETAHDVSSAHGGVPCPPPAAIPAIPEAAATPVTFATCVIRTRQPPAVSWSFPGQTQLDRVPIVRPDEQSVFRASAPKTGARNRGRCGQKLRASSEKSSRQAHGPRGRWLGATAGRWLALPAGCLHQVRLPYRRLRRISWASAGRLVRRAGRMRLRRSAVAPSAWIASMTGRR